MLAFAVAARGPMPDLAVDGDAAHAAIRAGVVSLATW
jgi:hypothetical protein